MNQLSSRRVRRCTMPCYHPQHEIRRTFAEVRDESDAQDPAPETHIPVIRRALCPSQSLELLDWKGAPEDSLPKLDLLNESQTAGYALVGRPKILNHHKVRRRTGRDHQENENWGEIWSCVQYKRTIEGKYQTPQHGYHVAIKKLRKRVVDEYLLLPEHSTPIESLKHIDSEYLARVITIGGRENPYREMSRMDKFGDNIHVLRQLEFLQDDDYIYIVMPHASERGTLYDVIFHGENRLTITKAQSIFNQILNILVYLERCKVHHRDLSPDNFIFIQDKRGDERLVVIDLAMSILIPVNRETGRRTLIRPMRWCGTLAFMAPEIYHKYPFDGVSADLWSAVLILYCMLTRILLYESRTVELTKILLYETPESKNVKFKYFVMAGAITQNRNDRLVSEILGDVPRITRKSLQEKDAMHKNFTEDSAFLFHQVFQIPNNKRWTLANVIESAFCTTLQE